MALFDLAGLGQAVQNVQQRVSAANDRADALELEKLRIQREAPEGFAVDVATNPFTGLDAKMRWIGMEDPRVKMKLAIAAQQQQAELDRQKEIMQTGADIDVKKQRLQAGMEAQTQIATAISSVQDAMHKGLLDTAGAVTRLRGLTGVAVTAIRSNPDLAPIYRGLIKGMLPPDAAQQVLRNSQLFLQAAPRIEGVGPERPRYRPGATPEFIPGNENTVEPFQMTPEQRQQYGVPRNVQETAQIGEPAKQVRALHYGLGVMGVTEDQADDDQKQAALSIGLQAMSKAEGAPIGEGESRLAAVGAFPDQEAEANRAILREQRALALESAQERRNTELSSKIANQVEQDAKIAGVSPIVQAMVDARTGKSIPIPAGTANPSNANKVVPFDQSPNRDATRIFVDAVEKHLKGADPATVREVLGRIGTPIAQDVQQDLETLGVVKEGHILRVAPAHEGAEPPINLIERIFNSRSLPREGIRQLARAANLLLYDDPVTEIHIGPEVMKVQ